MHPDDVAAHVAVGVEELKKHLAERPELGAGEIFLLDNVDLRIEFKKTERSLVQGFIPSQLLNPAGGGIQFEVPVVDLGAPPRIRELILRMDCEDFDGQPPTAELLCANGTPLPDGEWPRDPSGQGIVRGHQIYGSRPFFCRPGLREFHTHPQHEDEPWDRFREALPLHQIALDLLVDLTQRFSFSQ